MLLWQRHIWICHLQTAVAHVIVVMSYMDTSYDVAHAIVVMSYMDMSSADCCSTCYCGDVIYGYVI
jgi:hypothetical protein